MTSLLALSRRGLLRALGILGTTLVVAQANPVLSAPESPRVLAGMTSADMSSQVSSNIPVAPKGAPNVVVVLLDDVGFGAAGTFGGPIPTPTLDALAADGLRYNNFHTTGICSPTRASLLTGRNSHAVGMGNVMNSSAAAHPGRNGFIPKGAATVAEILRRNGYGTSAWGKWHLTPHVEENSAGPFDRWPTNMGFERFYGFLDGETHQFEPTLVDGVTPVARPSGEGYHLTEDITTRAIAWMRQQKALAPEKPFFVYYAPGATHAPFHAPREWIDRFRGQFDQGWDAAREETFLRQKKLGVIPVDAQLTPRMKELPAWDSLTPDRKRIVARIVEAYAGFLAHTDDQIGRLVRTVREMGEFDNTLFFYIVGDNGASGEGGLLGTLNEMGNIQGISESDTEGVARLDEIGGTHSYPHYPAGWAWAMNTPFQWHKQVASHLGGIRNPMVVSWPKNIRDKGGLRGQFSFVADILPTILEAAGITAPATVNGVTQQPIDGTSLVYSFGDAKAPSRHTTQYFEIYGNRAIYHQGWMASAFHGRAPWAMLGAKKRGFDEDGWELYNLDQDFSQSRDLAQANPVKLKELQELFLAEAGRNQVLPMESDPQPKRDPRLGNRTHFVFHSGFEGIAENAAPQTVGRSHQIVADLQLPKVGGAQGVLAALGGSIGGWSLYVNEQGQPVYVYNLFGVEKTVLTGKVPLPTGRPVRLTLDFAYDGGGYGKGARVTLLVDGTSVAESRLKRTAPIFFSIDENFDIGVDSGSPVGDYSFRYPFTGRIDKVTLDLK